MVPSKELEAALICPMSAGRRDFARICKDNLRSNLLPLGVPDTLKGGLSLGELHELEPVSFVHNGAALGFALALSTLGRVGLGAVVVVQQDFAALEAGHLYGLGCDLFGLGSERLLVVRAANPRDALWAMEEALGSGDVSAVIGELAENGKAADLIATRRLSLAAQKGGRLALLIRQHATAQPSAAATRWCVAAVPGDADGLGGLERSAFRLTLTKNRRGPCGSWVLQWDHHDRRFLALSVAVAASAVHRPAEASFTATG